LPTYLTLKRAAREEDSKEKLTMSKPVDKVEAEAWRRLKPPWRGRVAWVIFGLTVFGALVGLVDNLDKVRGWLESRTVYVTPDEITCLNEWVLRLAQTDNETDATRLRSDFLNEYKDFGHVNAGNEPIWINNVHVVRDIQEKAKWLVVIDMYPGASTQQCMIEGKREMLEVLDSKPDGMLPGNRRHWEDTIGHFLRPAAPLCYDLKEFESTNGKIQNNTPDVQDQRNLGPCGEKLQRAPGKVCQDP
jgi:hypothetical protein